ncbi:MAG: hypothetical protein ACTSQ1_03605 [Promethearchaeota archaeon]
MLFTKRIRKITMYTNKIIPLIMKTRLRICTILPVKDDVNSSGVHVKMPTFADITKKII